MLGVDMEAMECETAEWLLSAPLALLCAQRFDNTCAARRHNPILVLDGRYSSLASGYSEIQSVSRSFLNTEKYRAKIQSQNTGVVTRVSRDVLAPRGGEPRILGASCRL